MAGLEAIFTALLILAGLLVACSLLPALFGAAYKRGLFFGGVMLTSAGLFADGLRRLVAGEPVAASIYMIGLAVATPFMARMLDRTLIERADFHPWEGERPTGRSSADRRTHGVTEAEEFGMTPLHLAALDGRFEEARSLIAQRASVSAQNKDGRTPLHFAALGGHHPVAQLLIDTGASVDARDKSGGTPLHLAAMHGHRAVAELLLDRGAALESRDRRGRMTPLYAAMVRGHYPVAELLYQPWRGCQCQRCQRYNTSPHGCPSRLETARRAPCVARCSTRREVAERRDSLAKCLAGWPP